MRARTAGARYGPFRDKGVQKDEDGGMSGEPVTITGRSRRTRSKR
jgi:hypothetical protein